MVRSELYAHIKGLGLQEEIKVITGKNFTLVSNLELETIVKGALDASKKAEQYKKSRKAKPKKESCCGECKEHTANPTEALKRLIEVLYKKKILLDSEVDYILQY